MKNKFYIIAAAAFSVLPLSAQETYENAKLVGDDLNGTARYVGMGGAMEALGADLSTIGTNPAGIGLFRRSAGNVSFGFVSQADVDDFANGSKTNMSFDQIGFVLTSKTGYDSWFNVAFNYHKSKNFNQILSAAAGLNAASQNKASYIKALKGSVDNGGFCIDQSENGEYLGYENDYSDYVGNTFTQMDYLQWNAFLADPDGNYGYNDAAGYRFDRAHRGYIGNYDFNISGNIHDRVFLGLTFGFKDVNYKGYSEYTENLIDLQNQSVGTLTTTDERKISGTGFDVTAGVIVRPIEDSPFRFGFSIATPTFYDLTTENYSTIINGTPDLGSYDRGKSGEVYDFKLYTPWKFGFSLGHTVEDYLAIGASYEYADYGNLSNRILEGSEYYQESMSDHNMNNHTGDALKGTSTLKLGVEYKPDPQIAVRFGYNYVSPVYNTNAQKNTGIDSPGSYYASTTDFTNWKSTNRITCGVGYTIDKLTLDLAYQYSAVKGDFHPFSNDQVKIDSYNYGSPVTEVNYADAVKVSNNRHQVLFTLGYRF